MARSSPSTDTRAPSAVSPAAIPAIRSDSLWRSSPAPRIVVRPRAWVAARHRIGISSIAAATSAGETSIASRRARAHGQVGDGLADAVVRARRPAVRHRLVDPGAHPAEQVEDRPAGRVRADPAQGQLGVRVDRPGDQPERGRGHVRRDPLSDRSHAYPSLDTPGRSRPALDRLVRHRHPARPEHPLGVIARRDRLADGRPAVGPQPRQQDRRLHLGARDDGRHVDRPKRGAADHGQWRKGIVPARMEHGAHRAQRFDDTSHRTAPQ